MASEPASESYLGYERVIDRDGSSIPEADRR
jgi:hypothetical protein